MEDLSEETELWYDFDEGHQEYFRLGDSVFQSRLRIALSASQLMSVFGDEFYETPSDPDWLKAFEYGKLYILHCLRKCIREQDVGIKVKNEDIDIQVFTR